jgi:hypothetical protein
VIAPTADDEMKGERNQDETREKGYEESQA